MDAMREAASSRAMDDVPGVTKVLVRNFVPADQFKRTAAGPTEAGAGNAPTRIVSVVRGEIGRAHVLTPVTNAHLVCRLLLEKKNTTILRTTHITAAKPTI